MSQTEVELIYDADCPNVAMMREQLLRAFADAGFSPQWCEWERNDSKAPAYVRKYGSPTVLVNGRDVVDVSPSEHATSCRLYRDVSGGLVKAPPVEVIAAALHSKTTASGEVLTAGERAGIATMFSALPAAFVALLPSITCPACWPVYVSALSAVGIEYSKYTQWLLPTTVALLMVAVGTQIWQATRHGNWIALIPGMVGAALVLLGRVGNSSSVALYGGLGLLVSGSLWNTFWVRKKMKNTVEDCKGCCTPETKKGGEIND